MIDDEWNKFSTWADAQRRGYNLMGSVAGDKAYFTDRRTQEAWEAWQARAAYSSHEPPAEQPMPFKDWATDMRTLSMQAEIRAYRGKVTELEARLAQPPTGMYRETGGTYPRWAPVEQPSPPPPVAPSAWYRGVRSGSPGEPDEYDVEMSYGDDQPEGKGWIPLYRTPGIIRLHDDVLRRLDEWFAAYMHDRQNHDEAVALFSQVRDLRCTSTKAPE